MKTIYIFFLTLITIAITAQTKVSITNGDWNSASTWSPSGVPSSTDQVKIYHEVTVDGNVTCNDTVFVYGVLNIAKHKSITMSQGALVLVSTSQYNGRIGNVGNNSDIAGPVTFQKWITRCDGFSMYGVPFSVSVNQMNWYTCQQCMPGWSNINFYNEAVSGHQNNGFFDTIGSTLPRGRGFFYWYANYAGGMNFPRQVTMTGTVDLKSAFDFNVKYTSTTGGTNSDGYNLVSNPFPGTLDWDASAWSRSSMNDAIYTWNSCNSSYASYVSGVGVNGGSRYISSMQGFWVRTSGNGPHMRVNGEAMVSNTVSLFRTSSYDKVLRLSLDEDEIAIRLNENATANFDSNLDALKMYTESSHICSNSNLWDNDDYAINSVKDESQALPVKVRGGGRLTVKGAQGFGSEYTITITDLVKGVAMPVTDSLKYDFTDTSKVSFQRRFQVKIEKKVNTTGILSQQVIPFNLSRNNDGWLVQMNGLQKGNSKVVMYDFMGRQLFEGTFGDQISLPDQGQPVIIQVTSDSGVFVKKVM